MSTTYLTLFLLFYPLLPITNVFYLLVTGFESAQVLFFWYHAWRSRSLFANPV